MFDQGNFVAKNAAPQQDDSQLHVMFAHIKAQLHAELGDTAFRSWIAPIEAATLAGGVLELTAPSRFVRDWVRTHYAERIRLMWNKQAAAAAPLARVEVLASAKSAAARAAAADSTVVPFSKQAENEAVVDESADATGLSSPLDARYTFANFVTGTSNAFAAGAARKVAEGAATFNPLVIHGAVGMGKTHLLQAIAHEARKNRRGARVVYMSAEKFMYQFVRALRFKDTMAFKEHLRSLDVLMVDDIQFICGKESTQEEFFHTFNALIDQGKQVVVSCDRSPAELQGLDEKLRSRLTGGLVAAIQPADAELRLEILKSKCALFKRDVSLDVLTFLAERITTSGREIEGGLSRLVAHAELTGRDITVESAEELLQDILRSQSRRVTIEDIQKRVTEHYNIRLADMHSPRRARNVARPRQMAMYLAKVLTIHSLPEIGRQFGGRDHTTIIHGIRKIEELLQTDNGLQEDVTALKRALGV